MTQKKQVTKKPSKKQTKFSGFKTPKFLLLLAAIVLFAGVGAYYLFSSRAAAPVTNAPAPPAVYLSPTSQSLGINTTFVVELRENSGTTAVNVVENKLTYPVALYDYVSIDTTTSAFTIGAEQTIDPVAGTIKLTRGASGGTSLTGDQLVAKLTFKSKTVGGTGVIAFGAGTQLISAMSNSDILSGDVSLGNATYIVGSYSEVPSVSITAPLNNSIVGKKSVSIIASAVDDTAVQKMEVYIDDILKVTTAGPTISTSQPAKKFTKGVHIITIKAYDASDNIGTSSVTITK